jgi:hypothetical protein
MKILPSGGARKDTTFHFAAYSLEPLSRYVLPSPSCHAVLAVGAIETAHHRAHVAEVRTRHRQIGVRVHRVGQAFQRPLRHEGGQSKDLRRLSQQLGRHANLVEEVPVLIRTTGL